MKRITKASLLSFIFATIFSISAFASSLGVVNTDVLNFRSGPSTSNGIIGQLYRGQVVQIVEHVDNEWSKVTYNNTSGYIARRYIDIRGGEETSRSAVPTSAPINKPGYVTASSLNFRYAPSTDSGVIRCLGYGTGVYILENAGNGWFKIEQGGINGYVSGQYIQEGEVPAPAPASSKGEEVVAFAKQFLGTRYVYGGSSPSGFDCSGYTSYVFRNYGISLPRTTYTQVNSGSYVSKGDLVAGDLVFFKQGGSVDHVGIYVGGGQFIHATRPGDVVKIESINSGYYSKYYYSGRRVL